MFRIQEMTWALKAESIRTILVTVGVDYKAEHRQDTGGNSPLHAEAAGGKRPPLFQPARCSQ